MGRRLSSSTSLSSGGGVLLLPGQLPTFGAGNVRPFFKNASFTVPAGVDKVRLRVHGGGGYLTYDGTNTTRFQGGAASVGALLSATGGTAGNGAVPGVGGIGIGGDFQASGGPGGNERGSGGGGAGSSLGDGGRGGHGAAVNASGGGGSVGGKIGGDNADRSPSLSAGGASAQESAQGSLGGRDLRGSTFTWGTASAQAATTGTWQLPFPMFAFPGHGGDGSNGTTGSMGGVGGGGGSASTGGSGYDGGGGGGSSGSSPSGSYLAVLGSLGGGGTNVNLTRGPGGGGGTNLHAGCGGGGFAYGVFAVNPGQSLTITIGVGALVIVEW